MRTILLVLAAAFLVVQGAAAQTPEELASPEYRALKLEEHPTLDAFDDTDLAEGAGRPMLKADSVMGMLDGTDSTWNRIFNNTATSADLACTLASTDSGNDNQFFDVYEIEVTAAETLEAEIVSGDFDTVMAIYCDPFDAAMPMNNLIFYDDDDGTGTLSAFTAADGIDLSPGMTYWVVVSSFGANGVTGNYQLDLTSPTVMIVPVELQSFSVE